MAQNFANEQKHVAAALAALKAEQAKEGKDCRQAKTQYDDTVCSGQAAEAADENLAIFFQNLKSILGEQDQKKLEASQEAWSTYRSKTCDAIYDFYAGGSIRSSAEARCETRLARERMRDLDSLYEGPLHH